MKVSDTDQDPAPDSRFQTMPEIEVGLEGISKLLKNLKTDKFKAAGPDKDQTSSVKGTTSTVITYHTGTLSALLRLWYSPAGLDDSKCETLV